MGVCASESKEEMREVAKRRRNMRTMKIKPLEQIKEGRGLISEKNLKHFIIRNFDKYDASGDGKLSKEELGQFFSDILKRKKLEKEHDADELAHKFISLIDLNGDQHLTREEIYQFYKGK